MIKNRRQKDGGEHVVSILICDDEAYFGRKMKAIVDTVLSEVQIKAKVQTFSNPNLLSNIILSGCDIALLDIDYEDDSYNGMDIAKRIRFLRSDAIIIFVTNYIEYAPEGYEVNAFRYVLKKNLVDELQAALAAALQHRNKETLKIQINGEYFEIRLEDILYLEVQQHSITAHLREKTANSEFRKYTFYGALSELEQQLEPYGFLRIHKSYLVNMKYLKKFQCREALLDNGIILRVGEKSYAENKRKYLLWKGWR